jgi:hypothetical protein
LDFTPICNSSLHNPHTITFHHQYFFALITNLPPLVLTSCHQIVYCRTLHLLNPLKRSPCRPMRLPCPFFHESRFLFYDCRPIHLSACLSLHQLYRVVPSTKLRYLCLLHFSKLHLSTLFLFPTISKLSFLRSSSTCFLLLALLGYSLPLSSAHKHLCT